MWRGVVLTAAIAAAGGRAAGEQCNFAITGPDPMPETSSMDTNTILINLVPYGDLFYEVDILSSVLANVSFGEWRRVPANTSVFQGGTAGSLTVLNRASNYPPPLPSFPCKSQQNLDWPTRSTGAGQLSLQDERSNIVAVVPAQAGSQAATTPCTWTVTQIDPGVTVSPDVLRIAFASFVTPVNTTYQAPVSFQMLCTALTTGATSWTATTFPGLQQQIPLAGCANTYQGCYNTASYWSQANYTALTTVGVDDPAGSGGKVTCSRVRAVDQSVPGADRSIGEFALPPWQTQMAGATMLLAVVGNNTVGADPQYAMLELRNYWTFGDVCDGEGSAKIQLIPPPPPPPQKIPEELGWGVVYLACFGVLACIVGAAFRGCRREGKEKPGFKAMDNAVPAE